MSFELYDTKDAYDKFHIKGAVHLDFSDFTEYKLNKLIPNKDKRILIYCANNFHGNSPIIEKGGPAGSKGVTIEEGLKMVGTKRLSIKNGYKPTDSTGESSAEGPAGTDGPYGIQEESSSSTNNFPFKVEPILQLLNKERIKSPVALNIPTYINLYYYGYKNVYELSSSININDKNLKVAGTMVWRSN